MYENANERNCCDERVMQAVKSPETTCTKAACLLECLRHINGMVERISVTLFCDEPDCEKFSEPTCLDSNIDIALGQAKCVATKLENIIARL